MSHSLTSPLSLSLLFFPLLFFHYLQIILALAHMHKYDVAYRNLKPENIMIDDKGHIKLIGFSCAKVTEISCSTSIDIPSLHTLPPSLYTLPLYPLVISSSNILVNPSIHPVMYPIIHHLLQPSKTIPYTISNHRIYPQTHHLTHLTLSPFTTDITLCRRTGGVAEQNLHCVWYFGIYGTGNDLGNPPHNILSYTFSTSS